MASPVVLSDLPIATNLLSTDVTLVRSGFTDYQAAISLVRNIDLSVFPPLPNGAPIATDLMLVSRIYSGSQSNFQVSFSQVGLQQGTKAWFFQAVAPINWTIIPNTGDSLLAVSDGSNNYAGLSGGVSNAGTWQQTGTAISIEQMPPHNHTLVNSPDSFSSNSNVYRSGAPTNNKNFQTTTTGSGQPHDHGNVWRPLANIGIICNKST